LSKAQNIKIRQ